MKSWVWILVLSLRAEGLGISEGAQLVQCSAAPQHHCSLESSAHQPLIRLRGGSEPQLVSPSETKDDDMVLLGSVESAQFMFQRQEARVSKTIMDLDETSKLFYRPSQDEFGRMAEDRYDESHKIAEKAVNSHRKLLRKWSEMMNEGNSKEQMLSAQIAKLRLLQLTRMSRYEEFHEVTRFTIRKALDGGPAIDLSDQYVRNMQSEQYTAVKEIEQKLQKICEDIITAIGELNNIELLQFPVRNFHLDPQEFQSVEFVKNMPTIRDEVRGKMRTPPAPKHAGGRPDITPPKDMSAATTPEGPDHEENWAETPLKAQALFGQGPASEEALAAHGNYTVHYQESDAAVEKIRAQLEDPENDNEDEDLEVDPEDLVKIVAGMNARLEDMIEMNEDPEEIKELEVRVQAVTETLESLLSKEQGTELEVVED